MIEEKDDVQRQMIGFINHQVKHGHTRDDARRKFKEEYGDDAMESTNFSFWFYAFTVDINFEWRMNVPPPESPTKIQEGALAIVGMREFGIEMQLSLRNVSKAVRDQIDKLPPAYKNIHITISSTSIYVKYDDIRIQYTSDPKNGINYRFYGRNRFKKRKANERIRVIQSKNYRETVLNWLRLTFSNEKNEYECLFIEYHQRVKKLGGAREAMEKNGKMFFDGFLPIINNGRYLHHIEKLSVQTDDLFVFQTILDGVKPGILQEMELVNVDFPAWQTPKGVYEKPMSGEGDMDLRKKTVQEVKQIEEEKRRRMEEKVIVEEKAEPMERASKEKPQLSIEYETKRHNLELHESLTKNPFEEFDRHTMNQRIIAKSTQFEQSKRVYWLHNKILRIPIESFFYFNVFEIYHEKLNSLDLIILIGTILDQPLKHFQRALFYRPERLNTENIGEFYQLKELTNIYQEANIIDRGQFYNNPNLDFGTFIQLCDLVAPDDVPDLYVSQNGDLERFIFHLGQSEFQAYGSVFVKKVNKSLPSPSKKMVVNHHDPRLIRGCILYEVRLLNTKEGAFQSLKMAFGDDVMDEEEFLFWFTRFDDDLEDLDYERPTEKEKKSIMDLPTDVVEKVVEKLELRDQLILRKVCRSLRSLIDTLKLDYRNLQCDCYSNQIYVEYNGRRSVYIAENANRRQMPYFYEDVKVIKSNDFLNRAITDITIALSNPKNQFEMLKFDYSDESELGMSTVCQVYTAIESFLISKNDFKISTRIFAWRPFSRDHVIPIFSHLKPGFLRVISIENWMDCSEEIKEMCGMEVWKKAEEVEVYQSIVSIGIQNFFHLRKFEILLERISMDNLIRLRDALAISPIFESCTLHLDPGTHHYTAEIQFQLDLYWPDHEEDFDNSLRYYIPNSSEFLKFYVDSSIIIIEKF